MSVNPFSLSSLFFLTFFTPYIASLPVYLHLCFLSWPDCFLPYPLPSPLISPLPSPFSLSLPHTANRCRTCNERPAHTADVISEIEPSSERSLTSPFEGWLS